MSNARANEVIQQLKSTLAPVLGQVVPATIDEQGNPLHAEKALRDDELLVSVTVRESGFREISVVPLEAIVEAFNLGSLPRGKKVTLTRIKVADPSNTTGLIPIMEQLADEGHLPHN